ncbi:hypothetical protein LOAG_09298 [Loa loa]|nr:hypothetical protein LOAG_09298 [Loa loa]EFO19195.1 hypothetical protein LOAG_09298 [Loa loa]
MTTVLQKGKHNKKERSQSQNLSLSSLSSSGFSSMDLVKNFERVENWRKNSLRFLDDNKEDEILKDEKMDDIASSEHKLHKSMEEERSFEKPVPKIYNHYAQRKPLISDLFINRSNSGVEDFLNNDIYRNDYRIRISDNDDCMNQTSEKYCRFANSKLRAQEDCAKLVEQTIAPCGNVKIAPYSCQTESQLWKEIYKPKESKTVSKNMPHVNSVSVEAEHTSSERNQKYPNKSTSNQKTALSTIKHSGLITNEGYVNHRYFRYPENNSSEIIANNMNSSCDAKKHSIRQCPDMMESATTSNRRNGSENQLFTKLPKMNCTRKEIKTSINLMSLDRSDHKNTTNTSDILNMNHQIYSSGKARDSHNETYNVPEHTYVPESNSRKKDHLKNMFIFPGKLLRNVAGDLRSERSSCKPIMGGYSKKPDSKIEQAKSQTQLRMEPIVHLVPIVRKKEQETMSSPKKKTILRKFVVEEPRHTPNIFMNPVYVNTKTGMTTSNGCSQQPEIKVPQWEIPTLYSSSRNNRRNASYEHFNFVPSSLLYPGQSRKTLRRFI